MEKKNNFVQVPLWLADEFKTVKEFQAFIKMYNGWCLMKDADGWYYRSKSKLKEDFRMNPNCSDTRVTQLTKRFEGLGILHIKSEGKKANWYKFDEEVLFNHIEEETSEQVVPNGKEQVVPKDKEQVVPKQEDNDRNKLYLQYNTKENIHDKISRDNSTCTSNKDIHETITNIPETDILHDKVNNDILHELDNSNEVIVNLNMDYKHELESVEELTNENKNKTIPPDINGYKFWDNPTWYVIELTSRPYDDTYRYLIDFIHYGELSKVREALSQLDDKSLAEQLNNEIDNCIQKLKSA